MINNEKYVVVLYYNELFEKNIENIKDYLSRGVIVHLFLSSVFKEELELNEYDLDEFKLALDNNLLYVYENIEKLSDNDVLISVDGKILNKRLYEKICSRECEFNNDQYEIITADKDCNYIIISGAGTGKTTTMINRLIYLKKTVKDFTFDKVAMITFTNKASSEMREKLIAVLEKYYDLTKNPDYLNMMDEAVKCTISTIHGFSKKLLNEFGKNININKEIKVKSFKFKRKKAIIIGLNYVFKNHKELYEIIKYYPLYDIEDKLLYIWEKLDNYSIDINSESYEVNFGADEKDLSKLIKIVITKAQEYLDNEKEYEIEIADLMKKLTYEKLFYEAKNKFDFLMVDEFQDSDNVQIDFVAQFCYLTGAKLLVVGDEKQSIYRFRGAEHTSFYRLKEKLKLLKMPIKEFSMTRNYRTDANLLNEINNLFINIDKKVKKFNYKEEDYIYSLVNKDKENKIDYSTLTSYKDDISDFYLDILESKNKNEYVSVLFRSNNDLKDFKEFCDRKSIPCRIDVAGGFYRHEAVRDFYLMIRALINPNSNTIMYSFIDTPYVNVKVNKEIILEKDNIGINEYLDSMLDKISWKSYVEKVKTMNILELIDNIVDDLNPVKEYYKSEYIKAKRNNRDYKKIAYIKTLEYKLNLEYLIYLIKNNFSDTISSIYLIENFLKLKISTDNEEDIRKPDSSYETEFLQCSTVHKAKGLEYDYVIIPKLTNRFIVDKGVDIILRSHNNLVNVGFKLILGDDEYKNSHYLNYLKEEKEEIIGEEARLLYVAMTRCKRKLFLNAGNIIGTESQNNWKSLIGGARY